MQYIISFLEGIITFISPCLLPMLPIYLSYFAGGGERTMRRTLTSACGFTLGFTLVFVAMGALAGTLGSLLRQYQTVVNLLLGLVVIFFGLIFLGVFRFHLFRGGSHAVKGGSMGFFSAFVFGIIFSVGWTPCVGVFLGSALMMASREGTAAAGILMLIFYSLGLGIPFVVSALILDRLKGTFDVIKKHYRIINVVSGIFLVLVGILMMTGPFGYLLAFFSV